MIPRPISRRITHLPLATEDPPQPPVKYNHRSDNHPRQLQYRDFISLLSHPAESAGAAFDGCAHGGEDIVAVVKDVLITGVVVDVDCDAAEGGDFGGEFGEAGVVLSV